MIEIYRRHDEKGTAVKFDTGIMKLIYYRIASLRAASTTLSVSRSTRVLYEIRNEYVIKS
jgi:hypothetical protein